MACGVFKSVPEKCLVHCHKLIISIYCGLLQAGHFSGIFKATEGQQHTPSGKKKCDNNKR